MVLYVADEGGGRGMSDKEKTNGSLAMAPRVITIPAANQETARKLRVAAYTRVSSNSKDQEHSFAAQKLECKSEVPYVIYSGKRTAVDTPQNAF